MFKLPKKYWKQLSFYGKYLYLYDEIKDKIYPYKTIRKLKELYWGVKNIPKNIQKVLFFLPTLCNYYWYDYTFLLKLWSKALEYNVKFYSDKSKVMMMEGHRKLIIRKMTELKGILDRLNNEDYPTLHKIRYKATFKQDTPIIKAGKIWGYSMSKRHSDAELKLIKANIKHEIKLRDKDLKNIGKILEKYLLTWWD